MRCGSTTLTNILKTQDSIFFPELKELHYFDQRNPEIQSLDQYGQYFVPALESQLIGEATPDYFSTQGCVERIHAAIPNTKLVLILRNPVARAWSHYRFSVATMKEIEPFNNALKLEEERLAHPIHEHDIYFSYLQRGRYIEHLVSYLSVFKNEQLHVLFLEDLNKNPKKVITDLSDFLNIETNDSWDFALRITNQASLVNIKADEDLEATTKKELKLNRDAADFLNSRYFKIIPLSIRNSIYRKIEARIGHSTEPETSIAQELENYFEPYNMRLEELLGRKLPW